ncbi:glucoamylase family protein [Chlamydiota bacterium]
MRMYKGVIVLCFLIVFMLVLLAPTVASGAKEKNIIKRRKSPDRKNQISLATKKTKPIPIIIGLELLPNLEVTQVNIHGNYADVTIGNTGIGSIPEGTNIYMVYNYRISGPKVGSYNDGISMNYTGGSFRSLHPGETITKTVRIFPDWEDYQIRFTLDEWDHITETNENDNIYIYDITLPEVSIMNVFEDTITFSDTITIRCSATEIITEAFINGVQSTLDSNMTFSAAVALTEGDNQIVATATDTAGNQNSSSTVTISYKTTLVKNSETQEEMWKINCGGEYDYLYSQQEFWGKDESFYSLWRWGYSGGSNSTTDAIIEGTDLQAVYRTNRFGDMSYRIDVPSGEYELTLYFAETYWSDIGERVFDVALEGDIVFDNIDIISLTGGKNKALELSVQVTVTDGCLDISFLPGVDLPLISGIEIKAISVQSNAFLDFIERKMFWFFWNDVDQNTKLVKWGRDNWGDDYGVVGSLPSNGFALSIYTIAVERGWVSQEEAYARVMAILNAFDVLVEHVNGFWYHYFDIRTGLRADLSEVSTVDSALFIMGALQAGEYFKDTHPDVKQKAEELYERMDWTWFTGISPHPEFVNMGWKPENDGYSYIIPTGKPEGGFYCNDWWNRFCESVFVDLLALGSPTYPVTTSAWTNMYRGWVDIYGYNFIHEPPLFTQQYHHLYFDLKNSRDAFTDYFLNTQIATLANRQTCFEDLQGRYEQKRWGLTACGSPTASGYEAYGGEPGGYHDGTVAPTAAGTSIMFTETESIEALRYMYFQYKHHIWGLHGFCDSFNVGLGYRNWSVNGLDNGALILGIENYRSNLIQDTFMTSTYVQDGLVSAGFYTTPTVSASSYEGLGVEPEKAYDGDLLTRWSSKFYPTPQWLEIDFKTKKTMNKVTIHWETAYAKEYNIQVSDDRMKWDTVYSTNQSDGGVDAITFSPVSKRYLRIYCTDRATEWGYSIWELLVQNSRKIIKEPINIIAFKKREMSTQVKRIKKQ